MYPRELQCFGLGMSELAVMTCVAGHTPRKSIKGSRQPQSNNRPNRTVKIVITGQTQPELSAQVVGNCLASMPHALRLAQRGIVGLEGVTRCGRLNGILSCRPGLNLDARFSRFSRAASPRDIITAQKGDGACIIEGFLTPEITKRLNKDITAPLLNLRPGHRGTDPDLQDLHGENTKRLYNLASHSRTWREDIINDVAFHAICHEGLGKQQGDYWLSMAHVIEIGPGSLAQPLHVDGAQWWPFWNMSPGDPEIMLNFLVAVEDTTVENGATRVIPGSQRLSYRGDGEEQSAASWEEDDAVAVPLKAGDCLLIGSRVVHQGGANITTDSHRKVMTMTVVSSCFTPEEAFPLLIEREVARTLSDRAKKLLGYKEVTPFGSAGLWTGPAEDRAKVLGF
ncbi:hypothetical protein Purlil1_4045 [Purpureocillium lilacinum]|uniref:Phytanoyl-CoA dioxygenase n=2 Tax=Purpureocillium lilacinum TaxID=33203 RepID=A0ABR0C622_PURLI|nr:hypothetical protein Purlil1_4045 [Purpureocillium lilacinum]